MIVDSRGILFAVACLLSIALACGGRTQARASEPGSAAPVSAPAQPQQPASPRSPGWLAVDSAARTVTLTLATTSRPGASSALINEYRNGEARVVVPVGWTVKWDWRNSDTASSHSLVVMVQREKIPAEGGRPSLTNAMSRMVTEGLAPGQTDQTTFLAEEAGWYWLLCGVPGHALAGEWLELRVDPAATTASVQIK